MNAVCQITIGGVSPVKCGGIIKNVGGGLTSERYTAFVIDASGVDVTKSCGTSNSRLFGQDWTFQVDAPGDYTVRIIGNTGQTLDTLITVPNCDQIELIYGMDLSGNPGDTVCQDFTTNNFDSILSFTFRIAYDDAIVEYILGSEVLNPNLNPGMSIANPTTGIFSALYFSSSGTVSLPDGSSLFSACFVLQDVPGAVSLFDEEVGATHDFFTEQGCNLPADIIPGSIRVNSLTPTTVVPEFGGCATNSNLGVIILGPFSGVAPYLFEIRDTTDLTTIITSGSITDNLSRATSSGLNPGTYQVTVIADDNSSQVVNVTIPVGLELSTTVVVDNRPSCSDRMDGTISLGGVQGGIAPFTSVWMDELDNVIATNVSQVTSLANGRYAVEVTDANGCITSAFNDLFTTPLQPSIDIQMQPRCLGSGDGSLVGRAFIGGTGNKNVTWSTLSGTILLTQNNTSLLPLNNIDPGQYVFTAVDQNGCIGADTIDLMPTLDFEVNSSFTDVTCFGDSDGTITLAPPPYSSGLIYLWDDGATMQMRTNLSAGTYNVFVSEALCSDSLSIVIGSPDTLSVVVDSASSTPFLCSGDSIGRIILEIESGITNSNGLTVDWTNNVAQDAFSAFNIPGGRYVATITTGIGCVDSAVFTIVEVPPIQFNIPPVGVPNCPGDTTIITVDAASGGVGGGYTFSVNGGPEQSIGTMIPIFAGTHSVEVFDSIGCSAPIQFTTVDDATSLSINLPDVLVIELGDTTQSLSPDIQPTAARGTVVTYEWTPDIELDCSICMSTMVRATESREYTLTITDDRGCVFSESVLVEVRKNRNVFFPDAFTPASAGSGGDGINDIYAVITGLGVERINYFRIFNRWGVLVYENDNILPSDSEIIGWNGLFQGVEQDPGVYVYVAEAVFIDNNETNMPLIFKGNFTLMR